MECHKGFERCSHDLISHLIFTYFHLFFNVMFPVNTTNVLFFCSPFAQILPGLFLVEHLSLRKAENMLWVNEWKLPPRRDVKKKAWLQEVDDFTGWVEDSYAGLSIFFYPRYP